MGGIIDTNILLYAANRDAGEQSSASAFLQRAAAFRETWFITEGILYEFLRVATHPKVFDQPLTWKEAIDFLQAFWRSPQFEVLTAGDRHWDTLQEILGELTHPTGNLFFDIRTVVLMREHGVREIYTTDTDFHQFREINVINPLR
jgi:toxin-antitoxin system PIN domain toxin